MYQAKLYSETNALQMKVAHFSLQKHKNLLKFKNDEPVSIIDIGMGDGRVSENILKGYFPKNLYYTGIDISKEMIEFARNQPFFSDKEQEVLDIATQKIPEKLKNKFNVALSFNAMHWVNDTKKAMQNIHNELLKDEGQIYLVFCDRNPVNYAFDRISKMSKWEKYNTDKWCSDLFYTETNIIDYYKNILTEVGFKNISCFRDVCHIHVDTITLRDCIITVNPVVKYVLETEKEEYINDFIDIFFNLDFNKKLKNGKEMLFTYPIVTVYAQKG